MQIYKEIKQGTEEWLELRAGVITGTKLKGILGGPKAQETAIFELIGEEFAPLEETYKSPAMERGNELEPIAKAKFEELKGLKVEEVGFIKSEKYKDVFGSWLGLSPDGIIQTGDIAEETTGVPMCPMYGQAIEIKCPGAKNHAKYIIENKLPVEYKPQVINYFLTMPDLEKLYFVTYNPDFYIKDKKLFIIEVTREELEKDIEKAEEKLIEFRKKWLDYINKLNKDEVGMK